MFPCYTFAAMNIEPKETELIGKVMHLFLKYGIKSLTMDDIARHLGVSKKTIYKYVTDKNDLVEKAMRTQLEDERCAICSINERGLNAIDEFFEVSKFVMELLCTVHPSIHYDMAKYHTDVFHRGLQERQTQVYDCIFTNLEKGKKEGLYRSDLRSDVIAKVYIARMDVMFDGVVFPPTQYNFSEVYLEIFRYHIRGIASEKGLEYLIQKVKKEKSNLKK
jgi:AcrR family transcriptional regulator